MFGVKDHSLCTAQGEVEKQRLDISLTHSDSVSNTENIGALSEIFAQSPVLREASKSHCASST